MSPLGRCSAAEVGFTSTSAHSVGCSACKNRDVTSGTRTSTCLVPRRSLVSFLRFRFGLGLAVIWCDDEAELLPCRFMSTSSTPAFVVSSFSLVVVFSALSLLVKLGSGRRSLCRQAFFAVEMSGEAFFRLDFQQAQRFHQRFPKCLLFVVRCLFFFFFLVSYSFIGVLTAKFV
eukprot:TRINITY_DN21627_c0_g1_i1.p1 TRINITY_DN21627_c0_g1~~TRINITY_DN21627_c0_g1_i1.p1  ORF type:complete len:174 (+),score=19.80 TRINITY_DN21627_c0_g1_i1:90-611(+)